MSYIELINKSRYNLKKYLSKEWDTSSLQDYSDKEIEKLYSITTPTHPELSSFGYATSCNFSLQHKLLPLHSLHVIYYNFPELNRRPLKITKNICDKVMKLYKSELFKNEDSIIIITCQSITETIDESINELYYKNQGDLLLSFSEELENENRKLPDTQKLRKQYFKNIQLFNINTLSIDILEHRLVPKHEIIRNPNEIETILETCNCTFNQLPIIKRNDAIGKILLITPGDICKIYRYNDNSCESIYYRACH